jgi:hypothetical protein
VLAIEPVRETYPPRKPPRSTVLTVVNVDPLIAVVDPYASGSPIATVSPTLDAPRTGL